ncbi:MAG: glycosyltransferase [Geminicoccaceae bacterium]
MIAWSLLVSVAVAAWLFLLFGRYGFWRSTPRLEWHHGDIGYAPSIAVIIPARDEAETIETAVRSLFAQDYAGRLHVIVVDDRSQDRTAAIVDSLIPEAEPSRQLERVACTERPDGWSGKLWAIQAGLDHLDACAEAPAVLLLTDADIAHHPANLAALLKKMVNEHCDLVSVMVRLRNQSFWERLLIPPFVFFFQMLYPFPAVNRPESTYAAAAGGCVLLRRDVLRAAGGIKAVRGQLIDDVALARLIKSEPKGAGRIWLGHAERTVSLRGYGDLSSIWRMVVRTADTQLGHSLLILAATITGMILIYLLPPLAVLCWPFHQNLAIGLLGLAGWLMMSAAFRPTLALYQASAFWAPTLPIAALFYTAMTIDSARRHRLGIGGVWKGRAFPN